MALFGPKSKEYGDLNRKSIGELNTTVEEQEKELQTPFAGSNPGLVPTSDETTQAKYLRGDGQWGTPAGGGGGTEDYEDLANKPAIDGTELTKNSTAEDLGLAKTTDLPDMSEYAKKNEIPDVPTKTSDLDNDSGFITSNDIPAIPSKTSDLDNDSGFLTSETDPTVPSWAKQQNPPTPATFDGEHAGLVPAPVAGDTGKFLKSDGSWDAPASGGGDGIIPGYLESYNITNLSQFVARCNKLKKNHSDNINCSVTSLPINAVAVIYADSHYHILTSAYDFYMAPYVEGNANLSNKIKASETTRVIYGAFSNQGGYSNTCSGLSDSNVMATQWGNDIGGPYASVSPLPDVNKTAEIFVTPGTVIYKDHGQSEDYVDNIVEVPLTGTYFYSDSAMTEQITPESGKYYMDIPTGDIYYYDGSDFTKVKDGLPYVEVSGTLTAGQTSVTLSDVAITASSTIDIYTDGDVDYVSATPGTGSITITFEEQQTDLGVKVRVS